MTVCDSYLFDNSWKSHAFEASGCGHFAHLQRQQMYNRNKVASTSFVSGKLLKHDFGSGLVFISVNSEVKCNSTNFSNEDHIGHEQG